jgi:hypothetical protein
MTTLPLYTHGKTIRPLGLKVMRYNGSVFLEQQISIVRSLAAWSGRGMLLPNIVGRPLKTVGK